jgi:hypothetical protein
MVSFWFVHTVGSDYVEANIDSRVIYIQSSQSNYTYYVSSLQGDKTCGFNSAPGPAFAPVAQRVI